MKQPGQSISFLLNNFDVIPLESGVYFMHNEDGKIIYIGKALQLRNRVRSYFVDKSNTSHKAALLFPEHVAFIDWIVTTSEIDALILEARLIRQYKPKYNVRLKDDKKYPYLCVTITEPFPRVTVRRNRMKDGNLYFGPYTDAFSMRKVLETLPKLFQIRNCDLKLPLRLPERPCLQYHINRCTAPCANYCNALEYKEQITQCIQLLDGNIDQIETHYKEQMEFFSNNLEYEKAAIFKAKINALAVLKKKHKVDFGKDIGDTDVFSVRKDGFMAALVLLRYRNTGFFEHKRIQIFCELNQTVPEILETCVLQFYQSTTDLPQEILVDVEGDAQNINTALIKMLSKSIKVRYVRSGQRNALIRMAGMNAAKYILEIIQERERLHTQSYALEVLQKELDLEHIPLRIEGYDISHLSGTHTVASQVVFSNGKPDKKQYRKYKIKTVTGIDDFASMREVLLRRLKYLQDIDAVKPDLILIDGGKGQLSAAIEIRDSMGLQSIPFIGLAKRIEEIFLPGISVPVLLEKDSPALRLLQQVRDEAHRFAITFNRSLRKNDFTPEWLEEIPGLGKVTISKIMQKYKTKEKLLAADDEELQDYIGKAKSKIIRKTLQP
jgi:excinuclease ABC subunit C